MFMAYFLVYLQKEFNLCRCIDVSLLANGKVICQYSYNNKTHKNKIHLRS